MPRKVVLIVMDTLSAFNLPMYGYDRDTSPFLKELSEENMFFRMAYSTSPWTVPSHASIFTGKLPSEHGTTTRNIRIDDRSVVEDLQSEGFRTYGFCNNHLLPPAGFSKGFDYFIGGEVPKLRYRGLDAMATVLEREQEGEYSGKKEKYFDFLKEGVKQLDLRSVVEAFRFAYNEKIDGSNRQHDFVQDSGAEATNHLVREKLREEKPDDFFLFINYMEPHQPFDPPEEIAERWLDDVDAVKDQYWEYGLLGRPDNIGADIPPEFGEQLTALYDAEIRYLDAKIRELYDFLTSEFDDLLVIITSDHGENIGHEGMWGHHFGIWERLIRVPLIVAGEGVPRETVDRPVSLKELRGLISGDIGPEELGEGESRAEYFGHRWMGVDDETFEDYSEEERNRVSNRSACLVNEEEGAIAHTHQSDVAFESNPAGPGIGMRASESSLLEDLSPPELSDLKDVDI